MLSIGAMGSGQGNYYVGLAREDYYLNGGEPPGRWIGQGAERLGFTSPKVGGDVVERATFLAAFEGFQVDGGALVQNAGSERRQPGWDLTFSAPKSVSLVWALADAEVHKAIGEAHFESVKAALSLVEDLATTRRGKGGAIHEKADLVIATFEHGTSRAQDPQLHTHALVLNLAVRADGTTGALESKAFYESKMTVGALYRAALSARLVELGFEVECTETAFEIKGVPPSLITEMSKRRAEVEAALESRGEEGARASAFAALDTRTVKEHVAREILVEQWRAVAEEHDFGPETVRSLRFASVSPEVTTPQAVSPDPTPIEKSDPLQENIRSLHVPTQLQSSEPSRGVSRGALRSLIEAGLEQVMAHESHFNELDLLRAVACESVRMAGSSGKSVPLQELRQAVRDQLNETRLLGTCNTGSGKERHQIVYLGAGAEHGGGLYTTQHTLNTENSLLEDVGQLRRGGEQFQVRDATLQKAISKVEAAETAQARKRAADPQSPDNIRTLNSEQRAALEHITQGAGRISVVSGMAGTGKTTLLKAAREAWEAEGYTVVGTALAGKATRGLKEGAGIESFTIAKFLAERQRGFEYSVNPELKRLVEIKYATWQIDSDTRLKMLGEYHQPTSRLMHEWKYVTWQISKKHRDFLNHRLYREKNFNINDKTVLVVDEAGMVGTSMMAELVQVIKETGAKLVLVGDARQLQPVEAGGPFRAIESLVGGAALTDIVRQQLDKGDSNPAWRREAVKAFAEQRAGDGLRAYEERGFVTVHHRQEDAMKDLVKAWREKVTEKKAEEGPAKTKASVMKETLIFANTRKEVGMLNEMIQGERARNGELGFRRVTIQGQTIREKDRVIITQTDRTLNVDNGDLGTVKRLELITGKMLVKLDDGREVSLPYHHFDQVQLGYAITTHKGQGVTVDNAFVLCGGAWTDREKAYVQASRARIETRFFSTSENLVVSMSRSNQKNLAKEVSRGEVDKNRDRY